MTQKQLPNCIHKEGYSAILLQKIREENKFSVYYYSKKMINIEKKLHLYELEI